MTKPEPQFLNSAVMNQTKTDRSEVEDDIASEIKKLVKTAKEIESRVRELDRSKASPRTALALTDPMAIDASTDVTIALAKAMIAQQRQIPDFEAPWLFDNRNWLLILELFIADHHGAQISVKEASFALGGANSTAQRRLQALEAHSVIESRNDPNDGRRRLVGLSQASSVAVARYLHNSRQAEGVGSFRLRLRTTHISEARACDGGVRPEVSASLEPGKGLPEFGCGSVLQS